MTPIWVYKDDAFQAVCRFVAQRIWGADERFLGDTAMAVVDSGDLVAGVIFHNYDPEAGVIELSAASDTRRWLTRPVLLEMYSYCFDQLGCQAVIQRSDPENKSLSRCLTAYGFDRHDIPRLRGRNKAEAVFILGDDTWRANGFHKEHENGQVST